MRFKRLRAWRYPNPTPRYVWVVARIELALRRLAYWLRKEKR